MLSFGFNRLGGAPLITFFREVLCSQLEWNQWDGIVEPADGYRFHFMEVP